MKSFILASALLLTGCTWDKAAVIEDEEIIQEITKEVMELKPVKAQKDGQKNQGIEKNDSKSPEAGKIAPQRRYQA